MENNTSKNIVTTVLIVMLSGCATGSDKFSSSLTREFDLTTYDKNDLENSQIKTSTTFIYTLLSNTKELRTHQFNGEEGNEVYVSNDKTGGGYAEIVVKFERDTEGNKVNGIGKQATNCENMGSFNYKHPEREPLGHFAEDILPWIMWGNCRDDAITIHQRIVAYVDDIELALEHIVAENLSYYLPEDFSFSDSGQAQTVAFFLKAADSSDFDLHVFAATANPSTEQRKEFYRVLEKGIHNLITDRGY